MTPPGRGEKQRKKRGIWPPGIKGPLNAATESADLIDAVHDALPERYQAPHDATPQEKLRALYRHAKHISMPKAAFNIALAQAEDRAFGTIGKALAKASGNVPGQQGLQAGYAM